MRELIKVGTRKSPLALVQVAEVLTALRKAMPGIRTEILPLDTAGDKDKKTPISAMEGTDFFTKEIDEALMLGKIDCAVHSAKDLPDIIPAGIEVAALTRSIDPYDVLVSRSGLKLRELPEGARVGTSSERRKKQLLAFRPDFRLVDIRGTMQERLDKLNSENLDAVVIAGAGLIRLGLAHHITERISLKILKPHPLQGSLAVTVRRGDKALKKLFSKLHRKKIVAYAPSRKRILITGTSIERFKRMGEIVHAPLIEIKPVKDQQFVDQKIRNLRSYNGLIFTSRHAVLYFLARLKKKMKHLKLLAGKEIIAIGRTTAGQLSKSGLPATLIAGEESAEGIVKMLRHTPLQGKRFLIPRSELSNHKIADKLRARGARVDVVTVYRNVPAKTKRRDLGKIDEIIFTSPSTVKNFFKKYDCIPSCIKIKAIGPVTKACLRTYGIRAGTV